MVLEVSQNPRHPTIYCIFYYTPYSGIWPFRVHVALNPKPETLNPKPQTPNPKPYGSRSGFDAFRGSAGRADAVFAAAGAVAGLLGIQVWKVFVRLFFSGFADWLRFVRALLRC